MTLPSTVHLTPRFRAFPRTEGTTWHFIIGDETTELRPPGATFQSIRWLKRPERTTP